MWLIKSSRLTQRLSPIAGRSAMLFACGLGALPTWSIQTAEHGLLSAGTQGEPSRARSGIVARGLQNAYDSEHYHK